MPPLADAFGAEPTECIEGNDERAALHRVERDLRERPVPLRDRVRDLFRIAMFPDDDLHPRMNEASPAVLLSSMKRSEIAVGDDALANRPCSHPLAKSRDV